MKTNKSAKLLKSKKKPRLFSADSKEDQKMIETQKQLTK